MATLKKISILQILSFLILFSVKTSSVQAQGPKINSFFPTYGKQYDTIQIRGDGFSGGTAQVKFGVTSAYNVIIVNDTLIKAILNNGSSGWVKVTKSTGSDSLSGFNYCGIVSISANAIQKEPSTNTAAVLNVGCGVTETYKIKKLTNAISYNWYMFRGSNSKATIVHLNPSGINDTAVTVTYNTGYTQDSICVKGINACNVQSTTLGYVVPKGTFNPPTLISITSRTGNFNPCIGDTISYKVNSNSIGSSYSPISKFKWTIPNYTTIMSANTDSSVIKLRYNTGFIGGSINVYGQTCYGLKTSILSKTISYLPSTPSNIISNSTILTVCKGYVENFYVKVDSPSTGISSTVRYRWTIPPNTQIVYTPTDSSFITLKFANNYSNAYLSVQAVTACNAVGGAKTVFLPIDAGCINPVDTIYGPLELCPYFINSSITDTIRYSITPITGAKYYKWSFPTGVTLISGDSTSTSVLVVVDSNLTSNYGTGRISVCGVSDRGTFGGAATIRLFKTVPVLGSILGPSSNCSFIGKDTIINYSVAKVDNVSNYSWEALTPSGLPATGVEFISGIDSNVVSVKFKSDFISGTTIRVKGTAVCGVVSPRALTFYRPLISVPSAIRKSFVPLAAAITNVSRIAYDTLRIKKVVNATNYIWKLSNGTNATITHLNSLGVNDTAIVVNILTGFSVDTVSVAAATDCDKSAFISLALSALALPPGVASISGNLSPCIDDIVTYTATARTPTSIQASVAYFKWTIPANTQIIAAASDSSFIQLKFKAGYKGGAISARTVSSAGALSSTTYRIILKYGVATPTSISSSTGNANACIGDNITYTAVMPTLTSSQAPAVRFIWTKPSFTTIVDSTLNNQSITLSFINGYVGGNLTVKGQSACGVTGAAKLLVLSHTGCASGAKIRNINTNQLYPDLIDVQIYPNPTKNEFNLGINFISKSNINIRIFDLQGILIKSLSFENTSDNINIGKELKSGTYFFEINNGKSRKIIKAVKL